MIDIRRLDPAVATAFYGRFSAMRSVQDAAIEPILQGKNVVLSSGTGSGKTEAVLAPLVSLYRRQAIKNGSLLILYIAPTKALVNDLENRIRLPLQNLDMTLGVRHGDRDDLASGLTPNILITTPESLDVLLQKKEKRLATVSAVVVDEVHLLYNTQRGLHTSILLSRLNLFTKREIQCVALSATAGTLSNIRDFLFDQEEQTVFLQFPAERSIDAYIRHVADEASLLKMLKKLMGGKGAKLLLFANSRRTCERLAGILSTDKELEPFIFAHYSSLSPELRVETEKRFSIADKAICVSTSTLELGIDIGDIDAVILWGPPASVESFLQRIGRGNRRQNKTNAICLVPDDSDNPWLDTLIFLALIDASRKGELPALDPYELYGACGQQCISVIASQDGRFTRIADLCHLFETRRHLPRPVIEDILAELADKGYLQRHGFKNQYGADQKLYELVDYRMIYGNFSANSQVINVFHGSKKLGTIPSLNLLRVKPGMSVRFAGKPWSVRKASFEGYTLEPSTGRGKGGIMDFIYPGGGPGFDPFLCNRIWNMLHQNISQQLMPNGLYQSLEDFRKGFAGMCSAAQIPYLETESGYLYLTFGGFLVNKAVALITNQWNFKADNISIYCASPVNWQEIPSDPSKYESVFHSLFEVKDNQSLYQTLLPESLQLQEYIQSWLKDNTIREILIRLKESEARKVDPEIISHIIGIGYQKKKKYL